MIATERSIFLFDKKVLDALAVFLLSFMNLSRSVFVTFRTHKIGFLRITLHAFVSFFLFFYLFVFLFVWIFPPDLVVGIFELFLEFRVSSNLGSS